jgi:quercetin dioxygenase-like cupin family protein
MKIAQITLVIMTTAMLFACNQTKEKMENSKHEPEAIFPKGEKGSKDLFTGTAYPTPLVEADSVYNTLIGNVYFEPGARSNWHTLHQDKF